LRHAFDASDDFVQVQHLGSDDLLSGKSQQLLRQRARGISGILGLGQILLRRMRGAELLSGELDAAQDHRQQVVEVVRHSASEAPDGLHPLGV